MIFKKNASCALLYVVFILSAPGLMSLTSDTVFRGQLIQLVNYQLLDIYKSDLWHCPLRAVGPTSQLSAPGLLSLTSDTVLRGQLVLLVNCQLLDIAKSDLWYCPQRSVGSTGQLSAPGYCLVWPLILFLFESIDPVQFAPYPPQIVGSLHCPKNNLYLCIKYEPVTFVL